MFLTVILLLILSDVRNTVVPDRTLRERRSPQYYSRPPPSHDGWRPPPPHDGWRPPPPHDGRRPPTPHDGWRPPPPHNGWRPPTPHDSWSLPPPEERHNFYSPKDNNPAALNNYWKFFYSSEYWRPPGDHNSRPPPPPDDYGRPPPPPPDHHGRRPPPHDDYDRRPPPDDRPPHDHGRPPPHEDYGRAPPHNHGRPPPHDDYGRPLAHEHNRPSPQDHYNKPQPRDDFRPPYDPYGGRKSPPPPSPPESDYSRTYLDQHSRQLPEYNGGRSKVTPDRLERNPPPTGEYERPQPLDDSHKRESEYTPSQLGPPNNKPWNTNVFTEAEEPAEKNNAESTNDEEQRLVRYIERIIKEQHESTTLSQSETDVFKDLSHSKRILKYSLPDNKEKVNARNDSSENIQSTKIRNVFDVRDGFGIENTPVDVKVHRDTTFNEQYLSKNPPAINKPFFVPLFQAMPVTPAN